MAISHPAPDLAALVALYCLCDDPDDVMTGQVVRTAPQQNAVVCLQLGGDVVTDFRDPRPVMSLAGIQSQVRSYRPLGRARSLIVFLTALGTVRLFPSIGPDVFDTGHDMAGLIGDGEVLRLRAAAGAVPNLAALIREFERWLRRRLQRLPDRSEFHRLAAAMDLIGRRDKPVADAARAVDLSERHLERSFHQHLGLTPKRHQQIHRVGRSLRAEVTGQGDALAGYADQAHQIRSWRSFLGFTPGSLRKHGPSPLGAKFAAEAGAEGQPWAHYL